MVLVCGWVNNMRLLIFGQTGQVASELCLQATNANIGFTSLNREQLDVRNSDAIAAAIAKYDCDIIINATAFTNVDGAESDKELALIINAQAPHIMAIAAQKKNIPFIHISTDYVFRGDGNNAWQTDDPVNPINHYGKSKAEGERLIATTSGRNIILRTSWVFSNFGKNFVKTILRIAATNDELKIVGDQIGGPTSASDIASAILTIAHKEYSALKLKKSEKSYDNKTEIFHYSGMPYVSWAEFAQAIVKKASITTQIKSIPTSEYPTPADRPLNSRLDSSQTARLYGIKIPAWQDSLDICLKRILQNDHT